MQALLYHTLTDPDCAEVRRSIVALDLTANIDFCNIAYDSHANALKQRTGSLHVPCLIVNGLEVISGKQDILAWLRSLKQR